MTLDERIAALRMTLHQRQSGLWTRLVYRLKAWM